MALADLAVQARPGPVTLYDIAERQDISLSYLEQLFAKLRRHDLVKSVRGPGGGYMLARNPRDMPIADIVLAVDEPSDSTRCTPNQPLSCRNSEVRCLTHDLWEELGNQMYLYLRGRDQTASSGDLRRFSGRRSRRQEAGRLTVVRVVRFGPTWLPGLTSTITPPPRSARPPPRR
jgi:Rrf2 family iron-sulfur cluster assembly transcriptional regulator